MFRSFGLLPSDVTQHSFPLRLEPPTKEAAKDGLEKGISSNKIPFSVILSLY